MEKTAVEWLVEELKSRSIDLSKWNNDLLEQAKEMEKEQAKTMYSEEEVTKLLISCKDRFGGSDLYDYTHDNQVKKWFESYKKE
jgi:hypothetical protein